MSTLGWGVVGLGRFLEGTMAPAMKAEPTCDLLAAVSRDADRARKFADEFGVPNAYTDYESMLANPEIGAVYIATPNVLHPDQVVAAAQAGKHVFCEKPLAITAAEAAHSVRACDEAGVSLGMNFHNRYLDWVGDLTYMVSSGILGDIEVVEVDVGAGPRTYDNWRADPAMAGLGSVHNVGVHALDFLRVILGAEPIDVSAHLDVEPGGNENELLAMILMEFDSGTTVYLNCNERVLHPTNRIVVQGTKGRVIGTGFTRSRVDGELTVLTKGGEETTHYPAPEAHQRCLAAFTDSVLAGQEPVPSGLDGLASARLCEAIAVSAKEGRRVRVDHSTN